MLAGWRSLTLDRELATGSSPDDARLRMVRAERLTSPRGRAELAARWDEVLVRSDLKRTGTPTRIPLQYQQIRAAQLEIRQMVEALRSPLPVPVRGVAMVSLLLIDGTGPLYNPASCEDLRAWIRAAVDHLDPAKLLPTG